LANTDHRDALLVWLNKWNCRVPEYGHPDVKARLTTWFEASKALLPPEELDLRNASGADLADVFRRLHPRDEEHSWIWRGRGKGGASKTVRRRFDHIFASESLGAIDCHYVHDVREAGLSDHSAIVAEFVPQYV
jgi:exonuclease III